MTDDRFERRLERLREDAGAGHRFEPHAPVAGGPLPPEETRSGASSAAGPTRPADSGPDTPGYYGTPILKPPVWTWEVPAYFFVGGAAGMSALIGAGALLVDDDPALARAAWWTALAGAPASAALLVSDLGRPRRFLYMLRVFKWRSPMSVGAWLLTAFGGATALTVLRLELRFREIPARAASADAAAGRADAVLGALATAGGVLGAGLATYTGVLLGATAVPVWNRHRRLLPLHFGAAALGSAAALLELAGFRRPALHALSLTAATVESAVAAGVELGPEGPEGAARRGRAGSLIRAAGALSGPVALGLRALGWRRLAGASFLAGALLGRFGWMEAGRASARDPRAVLERSATGG